MSWFCPEKYKLDLVDVNTELSKLTGTLTEKQAQVSLARFLRHNLYMTVELLTGVQLAPYQEIILKGWMNRNFSLAVITRGGSKSYMAAIFCFLYPIFNPGAKIILAGPTFRTSRHIFTELEKMVESPRASMLANVFGYKARRNDLFEWRMDHPDGTVSTVSAIPLSGDKVRGFRANVLIIDEFLLMPQDIVEAVLSPFLSVPIDLRQRMKIRSIEDDLIKEGRMKPEERILFDNKTRVIFLSSASYTFEYLYQKYQEWITEIKSDNDVKSKYFVCQMGYEAIPEHMLSQEVIEAQKNGGSSHANFQREYGAQFIDDSEGYFSAKKMKICTVPDGEEPTIKLAGEKDRKYILAIDPSFSNSPTSDYFAMAVMELDESNEQPTLVHNYAVAGGDLKDHINYLFYLVNNFNIVMILIDNAGWQFIDSATESKIFKEANIDFSFFDFESDLIGIDYDKMVRIARSQYQPQKIGGKICLKVQFTTDFVRNANVHLQTCIDHKKVWFASHINPNGSALSKQSSVAIDTSLIRHSVPDLPNFKEGLGVISEFIDVQDFLMDDVKKQCALIEIKTTVKGTQSFDLPVHLKNSTSNERARKDNYTAFLLGTWLNKCYFSIIKTPKETNTGMFTPFMIQ